MDRVPAAHRVPKTDGLRTAFGVPMVRTCQFFGFEKNCLLTPMRQAGSCPTDVSDIPRVLVRHGFSPVDQRLDGGPPRSAFGDCGGVRQGECTGGSELAVLVA